VFTSDIPMIPDLEDSNVEDTSNDMAIAPRYENSLIWLWSDTLVSIRKISPPSTTLLVLRLQ